MLTFTATVNGMTMDQLEKTVVEEAQASFMDDVLAPIKGSPTPRASLSEVCLCIVVAV